MGLGYRVWGLGCRFWGLKGLGVSTGFGGLRCGARYLGCRVWGLVQERGSGFGVLGLGFGAGTRT